MRYEPPDEVWVSWCHRCGQFAAAGPGRTEVLGDCPYCPPDTPTFAYQFRVVKKGTKTRKAK